MCVREREGEGEGEGVKERERAREGGRERERERKRARERERESVYVCVCERVSWGCTCEYACAYLWFPPIRDAALLEEDICRSLFFKNTFIVPESMAACVLPSATLFLSLSLSHSQRV